jgi:hypothetical protein
VRKTYKMNTLRFSVFFSSVVRQIPGYNSQRRDMVRTSKFFLYFYCYPYSVICILCTALCKCVLYCCHRVSTRLQLKINKYNVIYIFQLNYPPRFKQVILSFVSYQQWRTEGGLGCSTPSPEILKL